MKRSQIVLAILLFAIQSAMAQVPFLVKDLYAGANDANPTNFTKAGDALYFLANDGPANFELWKTAGDSAFLVKDIYPGAPLSSIRYLTSIGSAVYFSAEDGVHGHELWKAEGDTAYMVKDINPTGNSLPQELLAMGDDLYFTAGNGITGR
jgi:ELWxxDGT repeat protein